MGGGFSFPTSLPSISNPFKDIKFPDNPFKDVSLGKKESNFIKGVGSRLTGNKQVSVQVRTGPFGFGRQTTQMRSVSSTPMSFAGISGSFLGDKISKIGRTATKPIFSNSNKPSLIERIKLKLKFKKKSNNIGNIEMSNMSQLKQQAGNKKKPSKKETTPSKKEKKSSKKEKNLSKKEKKSSKKEKKASQNKTKSKK